MPSSLHSTWPPGPEPLLQAGLDGERPRRVDPGAERRQDADAPVADLVAEALDDDRAVVRHRRGRLRLILEVADEVLRRQRVEADLGAEAFDRLRAWRRAELARERADRAAELQRAAGPVALPERHLAGLAGRRRDDHAVARDVLDPPARRAEQEDLAGPRLEHHLLVELADAHAVGQEHAEQAAVGDRAAVRDGDACGALARAHQAGRPVPHDAGPQLGELVAGVAARPAGRARP